MVNEEDLERERTYNTLPSPFVSHLLPRETRHWQVCPGHSKSGRVGSWIHAP
jgi:hypothetical protein